MHEATLFDNLEPFSDDPTGNVGCSCGPVGCPPGLAGLAGELGKKDQSVHTFGAYQSLALETASYPNKGKSAIYPALGIAGEAGEVCDKIKKIWRNTEVSDPRKWTPEQRVSLKLELGDVMWYLAAIATESGFTLQEIAESNIAKLFSRRERGVIKGEGDNR